QRAEAGPRDHLGDALTGGGVPVLAGHDLRPTRPHAGHPRLHRHSCIKAWMAGTSPANDERPMPSSSFMDIALAQARAAAAAGEVPGGCAIVRHGMVVARTHNRTLPHRDPTPQFQMLAHPHA